MNNENVVDYTLKSDQNRAFHNGPPGLGWAEICLSTLSSACRYATALALISARRNKTATSDAGFGSLK
jgi:hypothetical protein